MNHAVLVLLLSLIVLLGMQNVRLNEVNKGLKHELSLTYSAKKPRPK